MDKKKLIVQLKQFKKKIMKKHNVKEIIFFGSMAKGKPHKWSDVDILIVSPKFKGKSVLKRSPDLYLEWNLDYPVDFLCYTPEEYKKYSKMETIVKQAVKEGIKI